MLSAAPAPDPAPPSAVPSPILVTDSETTSLRTSVFCAADDQGYQSTLADGRQNRLATHKDRGGTPSHLVRELLLHPLVGLRVVPQHLLLVLLDHADVAVAAGPEIVEDTRVDRLFHEVDRLLPSHLRPPFRFEDGHGGERAGAHGHVGKLVGRTVRGDGEEVRTGGVDTAEDEGRADVALISVRVVESPISATRRWCSSERPHWKRCCLSMVIAVTTRGCRPEERACNWMLRAQGRVSLGASRRM